MEKTTEKQEVMWYRRIERVVQVPRDVQIPQFCEESSRAAAQLPAFFKRTLDASEAVAIQHRFVYLWH